MVNIVVFASGRGSNFRTLYQASVEGIFKARIAGLISNRAQAGAVAFAHQNNIPVAIVKPADFSSETAFGEQLIRQLQEFKADYILLAGYLKKIPDNVVLKYPLRILNIHPALLPAFGGKGMYGMRVHEAVFEAGVKVSGVTIHFVDTEYDRGPIFLQKCVDISQCNSPQEIADTVLKIEHQIYPIAVKMLLENEVEVIGRRVILREKKT